MLVKNLNTSYNNLFNNNRISLSYVKNYKNKDFFKIYVIVYVPDVT